ncbi:glycosyltransferase [Paenibacillus sp. NPDC058071]|uniref:glycosyltransferase n=1 Tax=Paenibacillus sp. NPDC058071 TaxID=3346326 RepID=UPI0036DDB5EE
MKKLLSLCMIVKNEEKLLSRCLDSVQGLVDEIIIVDTGSTDRTKEIASSYTQHVHDWAWTNDFSAARNESLRYASGEWILILDADEYVQQEKHAELREQLALNQDVELQGYILTIMNFTGGGHDETMRMESTGARIFRNHSALSYVQPIHEQLTALDNQEINFSPLPFTIYHSGYTKEVVQEKNKSQRNLTILERMKPNPNNEAYYFFTLGNEYSNASREEEALHAYRYSLTKSTETDSWFFHLLDRLISLELQQQEFSSANKHIELGLRLRPNNVDYHCLQGILMDALGHWRGAEESFKQCIRIAGSSSSKAPYWIIQPTYGTSAPLRMLAEISRKKGDIPAAISYWIQTLHVQPKNYAVLQQLLEHLVPHETPEKIIELLRVIYPQKESITTLLLFKMFLLSGCKPLAIPYKQEIDGLNVTLNEEDTLLWHLLNHDKIEVSLLGQQSDESVTLAAAILYDGPVSELSVKLSTACLQLAGQAKLVLLDQQWEISVIRGHEALLAKTLFFLLKYGYDEIYLKLLQQMANETVLNQLALLLEQSGRSDQALELFSVLLDNGLLEGEGLHIVAQWHFNMNERSDGTRFLEAALQKTPAVDMLGKILNFSNNDSRLQLLQIYYNHFPQIQKIKL